MCGCLGLRQYNWEVGEGTIWKCSRKTEVYCCRGKSQRQPPRSSVNRVGLYSWRAKNPKNVHVWNWKHGRDITGFTSELIVVSLYQRQLGSHFSVINLRILPDLLEIQGEHHCQSDALQAYTTGQSFKWQFPAEEKDTNSLCLCLCFILYPFFLETEFFNPFVKHSIYLYLNFVTMKFVLEVDQCFKNITKLLATNSVKAMEGLWCKNYKMLMKQRNKSRFMD